MADPNKGTLVFTPKPKGTLTFTPKQPQADGPPAPPAIIQMLSQPKPQVPFNDQDITA